MRVKCLAQEHNTMSPTRNRTQTVPSGDKRTNHEVTLLAEKFRHVVLLSFGQVEFGADLNLRIEFITLPMLERVSLTCCVLP